MVLGEADGVHDETVLVTLHLSDVRRLFRCRIYARYAEGNRAEVSSYLNTQQQHGQHTRFHA